MKKLLLSLLVLTTFVVCADYADAQLQWQKFVYFDNKGGLNDNLSTTEIADNEATNIKNIIFDVGGAIKKRNGYTLVPSIPLQVATGATSTGAVTGIFFYKKNNGNKYLVAICNQSGKAVAMKKGYNSTTGELDPGYWDNIDSAYLTTTTYNNNYQPDFAVCEDDLVFTDGTSKNPFVWSGTGKVDYLKYGTSAINTATGAIVEYHKNHLFVSGNTTNPSRVFYSELGDVSNFSAIDFFEVENSDGTKVRALCSAFDSLYIFKDKSIWRLSGQERDSWVLQKMVDGIGTTSNGSVRVVNNYIYFTTAQNDIALYDGAYTCQFISQKIRGTIGNLDFARSYYTQGLAFSTYKYNDFDYYVSLTESGGTGNNRILLFDTQHKAWSKFIGMNVCSMCVGDDADGKNVMYFGDYQGYVGVYPSSSYSDYVGKGLPDSSVSTQSVAAIYQTKWFKYSNICLGDKYWRLLKTYALTSDDTVVYAECKSDYESSGRVFTIDLEGSQAKWDVAVWDVDVWGGETIIIGRDEVEKGVNMFQLRYTQDSASTGFVILGWELFVEPTTRI